MIVPLATGGPSGATENCLEHQTITDAQSQIIIYVFEQIQNNECKSNPSFP